MKPYLVDRTIFIKNFVLQYPEFIRFLKKKGVYKKFFRALSFHGFPSKVTEIPRSYDWILLKDIVDRAFLWDLNRNDGMNGLRWSDIRCSWFTYVVRHIPRDTDCREKIKRAVWKTHMTMYKHQPWKRLMIGVYDLWNGYY
jgi:hypothetical protein